MAGNWLIITTTQLENSFSIPPEGGTPYFAAVRQIYTTYKTILEEKDQTIDLTCIVEHMRYQVDHGILPKALGGMILFREEHKA